MSSCDNRCQLSSCNSEADEAVDLRQARGKEGESREVIVRTLSTIGKLHMRRLLDGTKGIEHLGPAAPESEGKEEA